MLRFEGIVPPIVTPLLDGERVDEESLRRQAERLLEAGCAGFYLLGTTGEQPALRAEARERAMRVVLGAAQGRVPAVVGVMAPSTAHALDRIAQAVACGAEAVAVQPPYYFPTRGPAEQLAHYRACAEASPVPVVIYNFPQTTKVALGPAVIRQIAALPNVIGIKDSSGDFVQFLQLLTDLRDDPGFSLLIGNPLLVGPAVLYGGEGAVPALANIDPRLFVETYEAAKARDLEALVRLQARAQTLARVTAFGAPVACIKTALELLGVCGSLATAPLEPVDGTGREQIAAILRELGLLS